MNGSICGYNSGHLLWSSRGCSQTQSQSITNRHFSSQEEDGENPFLGFELLLMKRFQLEPALWYEWRERLWRKVNHSLTPSDETVAPVVADNVNDDSTLLKLESLEDLGLVDIHQDLWYLCVMLHRRPQYLLDMVSLEMEREKSKRFPKYGETLLTRYLNLHNFTCLSLDSIFKFGEDNRLPREMFQCPNVKFLSLKYNSLISLPCDIGRMANLEHLALTNNKLSVWSLPYSLTFLTQLHTMLLDNNLLDALPGFLPSLKSLKTVHRHGNHNYFKSTFMWYHTDVNLRIIPVVCEAPTYNKYESLQFWAAKNVIGSKHDFFADESFTLPLKDFISDIYSLFNICYHCDSAFLLSKSGFKVITFKNPYLGNTCVPFQHWACSMECAKAIEIPARHEQISAAQRLDKQYDEYVSECVRKFSSYRSGKRILSYAMKIEEYPLQSEDSEVSDCGQDVKGKKKRKGKRLSQSQSSLNPQCSCVLS